MFLQQLINGLSLGSIYALTAIGYSIIYGIIELINMSHGSTFLVSVILYYCFFSMGTSGLGLLPSMIIVIIVAAFLGFATERVAIRPIREKGDGMTYALITSIGLKTIIENLCQQWFGTEIKPFPTILANKYITIGNARMAAIQIVIICITLVVLILLTLFMKKTKYGRSLTALAQNLNACHLMGIPVNTMVGLAFAVSSVLAAIAGVAYCMYYETVSVSISSIIGQKAFAATLLGGIGSFGGSVLGGFVLGIVEMLTAGYIKSTYRDLVAFSILILVLLIKPTGFFGHKEQTKV